MAKLAKMQAALQLPRQAANFICCKTCAFIEKIFSILPYGFDFLVFVLSIVFGVDFSVRWEIYSDDCLEEAYGLRVCGTLGTFDAPSIELSAPEVRKAITQGGLHIDAKCFFALNAKSNRKSLRFESEEETKEA